jgi:hypothetical protein
MNGLAQLSRKLLPSLVEPSSGLFCHKATYSSEGLLRPSGTNPFYSAIAVIGIHSDDPDARVTDPVPVEKTLDSLVDLTLGKPSSCALLAATTWALYAVGDSRALRLLDLLENRFDLSSSSSADLGILLAALAVAIDVAPDSREAALRLGSAAMNELLGRFSTTAQLFGGSGRSIRPKRLLDSNLTSFASQVYPIHGLATYARATSGDPPREALRAADRVVELQGPLGQWWWIYSLRDGSVVEPYPVYSVHQDAMAFMALAPLENLGFRAYERELMRGLSWLYGSNELQTPLLDLERLVVSRCIQRRGADADGVWGMSSSQRRAARLGSWALASRQSLVVASDELEILQEVRPYHLGWALYARSLILAW